MDIIFKFIRKSYKSSNKKIIVVLKMITIFIKRAIEELKLLECRHFVARLYSIINYLFR